MQKRQYFIITILVFFIVLICIGLIHNGWKNKPIDFIYSGLIGVFFFLIIRQFFVWQIIQTEKGVQLKSAFGIISYHLEPSDFISASGDVEFKAETGSEIAQTVRLTCKQRNFRFYSLDYSDFNQTMKRLFYDRKDLLIDAKNQMNKVRKTTRYSFWFSIAVIVIVALLIGIKLIS